jgi:hypothetical protein
MVGVLLVFFTLVYVRLGIGCIQTSLHNGLRNGKAHHDNVILFSFFAPDPHLSRVLIATHDSQGTHDIKFQSDGDNNASFTFAFAFVACTGGAGQ